MYLVIDLKIKEEITHIWLGVLERVGAVKLTGLVRVGLLSQLVEARPSGWLQLTAADRQRGRRSLLGNGLWPLSPYELSKSSWSRGG